jgi:hypothetical protein
VRANYARAKSFHLIAHNVIGEAGEDGVLQAQDSKQYEFAAVLPNQLRFEGVLPIGDRALLVIVGAGKYFVYSKDDNQYLEGPAVAPDAKIDLENLTEENASAFFLRMGRGIFNSVRNIAGANEHAHVLRQDRLMLHEGPVDCWMVEIADRPRKGTTSTWWIDKNRYTVRREDMVVDLGDRRSMESLVFTTAEVDEPVDPELFEFSAPGNARRVFKFSEFDSK